MPFRCPKHRNGMRSCGAGWFSLGAVMNAVYESGGAIRPKLSRCDLPRCQSFSIIGYHHRCIRTRPMPAVSEIASTQSSNAGTRVGASRAVWNKRRRAGMVCQSAVLSHPMRATRPVPPRLMYPMTYSLRVHLYLVFFNSAFLGLHSRTTCTKRYPEVGGFSSSIWIMPVTAVVQKCGVGMHSVAARGRRYFVNGCDIREKGFASGFRCLSAGFRTPVGQQTINRGSVALHG
ncbi:beta-lactamase family protein (plasmid) [Ralstonia solanacearum]